MSEKIIVIGGGISGFTTALTLQLLGYETEIIADKIAAEPLDKRTNPEFASLFPSASIIPHSVTTGHLEELFIHSQAFFYELRKLAFPGLTIHKHFEIFEFEPKRPKYCDWMLNWQPLEDLEPGSVPHRPDTENLHGWAFDCIFADWPHYLPALTRLYRDHGGTITRKKLESGDIPQLPADTIINCSGTGSTALFDDPSDQQLLLRGHLLHKPDAPLITNTSGEIISYNYTPKADVYSDGDGNACDVYCYPRKDGWILGGSRQSILMQNMDSWEESRTERNYEIDGISFPAQIIDLNNEILKSTFGHSLNSSDELHPTTGFRYVRNHEKGLRLEQETFGTKRVLHNYGHGGAGVTLSWGCAFRIAEIITSKQIESLRALLLKGLMNTNFST